MATITPAKSMLRGGSSVSLSRLSRVRLFNEAELGSIQLRLIIQIL